MTGSEVLSWRLTLPRGMAGTRMEEFYREIGERVVFFCENSLRERAEEDFEKSEDPKKRFHFPTFLYRLHTESGEEGDVLTVRLCATLARRGEREPRYRREWVHLWSVSEDCLLPPKREKKNG